LLLFIFTGQMEYARLIIISFSVGVFPIMAVSY
jgi:hypothetical protein